MKRIKELLIKTEALQEGHFLLSSGKHSNGYVQSAKLLKYPEYAKEVVSIIIEKYNLKDLDIDLVVGPAMGGIIIGYEMARQLGLPFIFTERENNIMTIRRGFDLPKGSRVLIVEDVVTTGKSSLEAEAVINKVGGKVIGLAALVNRGEAIDYPNPIYSGLSLNIKTYKEKDCSLCKSGEKLIKPGSRKF